MMKKLCVLCGKPWGHQMYDAESHCNECRIKETKDYELLHPSDIWEWYRDGKRHPDGGKGFVSYPDYAKLQAKLKIATDALAFYAQNKNKDISDLERFNYDSYRPDSAYYKEGMRARKALEEIK